MTKANDFSPNWASKPGDSIADLINHKNLSLVDFSKQMNSDIAEIKLLIHGFISINHAIAEKLHSVIGGSIDFWISREENYRANLSRLNEQEGSKWIKELPINDMIKYHWIKKSSDIVNSCLKFFNVPDVWTVRRKYIDVISYTSFRKSTKIKSNPSSLLTWIRQSEIQAERSANKKWDPEKFKSSLFEIKKLSRRKDPNSFIPIIQSICSDVGVALEIVPTPKDCAASGAALFISPDRPVIVLSFRYKSDDQVWFTFFHEAGHILLHDNKQIFIDEEKENSEDDKLELEANEFAENILFPGSLGKDLFEMQVTERNIKDFANKADVSLGIVVGQLQHAGKIPYNHFNGYKRRYTFKPD